MKIKKFFKKFLNIYMFIFYLILGTFFLPMIIEGFCLLFFNYTISTIGFVFLTTIGFIFGLFQSIVTNDFLFEKFTNMFGEKLK